ncbi:hypothetical protein V1512DRAFT_229956 [Lipomyces arxii]|uniref:uncharacterized protein n=1 Tax=Lipomyces arxii TaxID=56418 RepID=UPI0034CDFFE2
MMIEPTKRRFYLQTENDRKKSKHHTENACVKVKHSLGLQPYGNLYLEQPETISNSAKMRSRLLGYFAVLPDEMISMLCQMLDAPELRNLGYTSRIFAMFATQDDLWKQLFVNKGLAPTKWYGTWRRTYYGLDEANEAKLRCDGFYSDVLYRPFFCAAMNMTEYIRNAASSTPKIPRLTTCPNLEEFNDQWATRPFILESHPWPSWTITDLEREYGKTEFIQECVRWKLDVYGEYMRQNSDESPLYLFDREIGNKTSLAKYSIPNIFETDCFKLLDRIRPDYRWLIIGPERSGSTFHKDPNSTSAWNAVIEGEKYWIMFPPNTLPPGVYTSEDESEVTSPLSIAEWILGFHKEAMNVPGYIDGFCKAGEVVYVPSGWWHLVVNLSSTAALTQNFVPFPHALNVLKFFHNKKDQISGFRTTNHSDEDENEKPDIDVFDEFLQRINTATDVPSSMKARINDWVAGLDRASKWTRLTDDKATGFSFGFDVDSE